MREVVCEPGVFQHSVEASELNQSEKKHCSCFMHWESITDAF